MKVDKQAVGCIERFGAQESTRDVIEHVDGQSLGALRHRRDPKVGAMRDQRGEQRRVEIVDARLVAAERREH